MELVTVILSVLVIALFYKVGLLNKRITVLSFAERNMNKLLVKKELVKPAEIDMMTNESIGKMPEEDGNKIIRYARDIGIFIPNYMNEEELEKYSKKHESETEKNEVSFIDRMIMNDSGL